jgi:enediyne biosynthesis protein CalE5
MFLPNLHAALGRIRQMLVTDGRLSAAVWSVPSKVPLLDLAFATARKQLNIPAPPPRAPGPFALANDEALKQSFIQAGFEDIRVDKLQITFDFESPQSYTRFHQQITAPIHDMLANHAEELKKRAWDSITEAVWQYADSLSW